MNRHSKKFEIGREAAPLRPHREVWIVLSLTSGRLLRRLKAADWAGIPVAG
ncbi:hypothetical protein [Victivallis sp. Marseille-Q1083]|uniref:hypothetical protein n=1 Tax=Victivallis sp. Marseille-Q1083 TaxID=2717288 RepID=UPI0015889C25|nr:hypothetical protein [Victivallis sp. Marseille-Q1083]